mmetsp:Transcript_100579/g.288199  ORF Transcript_100579/g.288199 Transcript_100579/m.288199 type:complete len:373 (+) Transcript_100579:170-1288(+)
MADEFTKPPEGYTGMGGLPHNGKKTALPESPKKTRKQLNKEAKEREKDAKSPTGEGGKKKKKEKSVDFSTQYKRQMNREMAEGLKQMVDDEKEKKEREEEEARKKKEADLLLPGAAEAAAAAELKRLKREERRANREHKLRIQLESSNAEKDSAALPATLANTPNSKTPKKKGMFASLSSFPTLSPVALSPFKKIRSFKNNSTAEAPPLVSPKNNKSPKAGKSPKATGGKVTIKRAKTGWNGNGKGFAHIVTIAVLTSTSEHLEPLPYKPLSDKKRRRQAARVIQKLARNGLLLGIRREKAAKLIQTNFRVYKEWLVTEKWSIMIKMEKSARGKKEKEGMLSRKKKEMRQAVSMRERHLRLLVHACRRTRSH